MAREIWPFEGLSSSGPPGSRTSGSCSGASGSISAAASGSSPCSVSRQFSGSRLRRAKSTTRRVSADERGPITSMPTP